MRRRARILLKSDINFLVQKHRIMQLKDSRIVHGTMHNHIRDMREKLPTSTTMTFNFSLKVKVCAKLLIFHNSSTNVENLGSLRCLFEKRANAFLLTHFLEAWKNRKQL